MSKTIIATVARSLAASAAALAIFASIASAPASAQAYYGRDHRNVAGVVASFDRFDMTLHIGPGQDVFVHLHQGTIIDPRGTTLRRGMRVDVHGYRTPNGIEAERIDFDGWARGGYHRY